jgi:hypothetical protein
MESAAAGNTTAALKCRGVYLSPQTTSSCRKAGAAFLASQHFPAVACGDPAINVEGMS